MDKMTPAQRSAAYYAAHKTDPAWIEKNRARAKAAYEKNKPKSKERAEKYKKEISAGQDRYNKIPRMDAALDRTKDMTISDADKLGLTDHLAMLVWVMFRAAEAREGAPFHPVLERSGWKRAPAVEVAAATESESDIPY